MVGANDAIVAIHSRGLRAVAIFAFVSPYVKYSFYHAGAEKLQKKAESEGAGWPIPL